MAQEDYIYKNQTALKIRLDTKISLATATTLQIKYKKPSGATGTWTAAIDPVYPTRIYYDLATTSIDENGIWTLWSYVIFNDGRVAPGRACQKDIKVEGT